MSDTQPIEGTDLPFTGERYLPEVSGQIAFEHLHRYYFARAIVEGRKVLDVACGEGYGSNILSAACSDVTGVDIDSAAVGHATERYGQEHVRFVEASAARLPFGDAEFDAVVSFETIEHHDQHEEMMSEIRRVLRPGGILVMSSPNKLHYSIEPEYANPYHVKELFKDEFHALVKRYFVNTRVLGQRVVHGSLIIADGGEPASFESIILDKSAFERLAGIRKPLYDMIIASDEALPPALGSLFEATVHGMDPAGFYGVHLPDRVAKADETIQRLRAQGGPMDQSEVRQLLEALSSQVGGTVVSEREQAKARIAELEREREISRSQLGELSEALDASAKSIAALQGETRNLQAELLLAARERAAAEHERGVAEHARAVVEHEKALLEHEKTLLAMEKASAEREMATLSNALQVAVDSAGKIEYIRAEQGGVQARLEIQSERLRHKEELLANLAAELESVSAQLDESRSYIEKVHKSRSWRMTSWLRNIARHFR